MLTPLQSVVLDKLRERNCHWLARAAEEAWGNHESAYMDDRVKCPRWLRRLFAEANDQALKAGKEANP
jgi:hypothetical protein